MTSERWIGPYDEQGEMIPHTGWVDFCAKCEDGYPYPHHDGDEADRHEEHMGVLDAVDPEWDRRVGGLHG